MYPPGDADSDGGNGPYGPCLADDRLPCHCNPRGDGNARCPNPVAIGHSFWDGEDDDLTLHIVPITDDHGHHRLVTSVSDTRGVYAILDEDGSPRYLDDDTGGRLADDGSEPGHRG